MELRQYAKTVFDNVRLDENLRTVMGACIEYMPRALCIVAMMKALIYIVNWDGNGQKRNMSGNVSCTLQPRSLVKHGRAILMAVGYFTRAHGGWWSYAIIAIAAAMRSAPLTSWKRHGIFWRRPRKRKLIRVL